MSVNSSSSSNPSLLHPHLNSSLTLNIYCHITRPGSLIFISFNITFTLLLLPLSIFVLYLGVQRWREQRSSSTSAKTSHSDILTYNMATMELVGIFGCILCLYGANSGHSGVLEDGTFTVSFNWCGEILFHTLTCVERYLAVVHPITYLSLRKDRGIRIRNITIGCVWLLCLAAVCMLKIQSLFLIINFCILIFSFIIISCCSFSVLLVLTRPRPGDQGGDRDRVDQSKQKAFYTIMAILGVLLLRFSANLSWAVLYARKSSDCVALSAQIWFNLPGSLVLPVLFLLRSGKPSCCKHNIKK